MWMCDRRAAEPRVPRRPVFRRHRGVPQAVTLSVLLTAAAAPAQSIHLGGKIGFGSATQIHRVAGDPHVSASRSGASAGIVLRVGITPWFALQGEGLYSEKGFEERPDFRMWMAYVEMPLLVRATAPGGFAGLRPVVLAGVVPARELSCGGRTVPAHIPESPPPDPVPLECSSMRTDLFDLGLLAGGGLATRIAGVTLTAEARYTHGMRDIGSGFEFVEVKNRAVSFLVGGTLRLPD